MANVASLVLRMNGIVSFVLILVANVAAIHAILVTEILTDGADGPSLYITFHGGSGNSGINQVRALGRRC